MYRFFRDEAHHPVFTVTVDIDNDIVGTALRLHKGSGVLPMAAPGWNHMKSGDIIWFPLVLSLNRADSSFSTQAALGRSASQKAEEPCGLS
eukprot:SAG22_NODE_253_length_13622_cov_15.026471_7_plen_91_part_00